MTVLLLQYFDRSTVGWVFWPVKTVSHITYTVLKLEGDVKHCSIQSNPILYDSILSVVVIIWGLMGRGVVYNEASCLSAWQFDGYRLHILMIVPNFVFCTQFYDCINGRAYATILRPSVCRCLSSSSSSVTLYIVAKWCVLEQKLLLTAYIGSRICAINWYQNEWPWPLFRGRLRSCQQLRHIRHWISQKPAIQIDTWFQRTINRKWPVASRMITWPITSRDPERSNLWPQYV